MACPPIHTATGGYRGRGGPIIAYLNRAEIVSALLRRPNKLERLKSVERRQTRRKRNEGDRFRRKAGLGRCDVDDRIEIKTPPAPRGNEIEAHGPFVDLLRETSWTI